jgi:hypothetical protein
MMSEQSANFASTSSAPDSSTLSAATAARSRSCRSVKLAWTDERSGEQLIVSIRGGAALLDGLAAQGFSVVDGASEAPTSGARVGAAGAANAKFSASTLPVRPASNGDARLSQAEVRGEARATNA